MHVTVNGKVQEVPEPWRMVDLLARHNLNPERVVVERNGEIVDRAVYATLGLQEGDTLELLSFVGGG